MQRLAERYRVSRRAGQGAAWMRQCLMVTGLLLASCCVYSAPPEDKAVPVILKTLEEGVVHESIQALGTTRANESLTVTVDTTEKISEVHFTEGQAVEVGALLVTLDQRQEQAELRAARAALEEAQLAFDRAEALGRKNAVSTATVQERGVALSRQQSAVAILEARLAELSVTAPFSGVLGLRQVSVGALVKPGDPITTLDDLSQIKVDFSLPSRYLGVLKVGLDFSGKVEAYGDQVFHGKVSSIAPRVDPVTRTVQVRGVIPNKEGLLKPGLLMNVRLAHGERSALMLPEEALVKRGMENFVYVAEGNEALTAQKRVVELGVRSNGAIEISHGLSAGEKVVLHGVDKVRPGSILQIKAEDTGDKTVKQMLAPQFDR